jgi:signal peptidase I
MTSMHDAPEPARRKPGAGDEPDTSDDLTGGSNDNDGGGNGGGRNDMTEAAETADNGRSEIDWTDNESGEQPPEIHYKGENLRQPKPRSTGQGVGEWIGIIVAALLLAFLIKTFVMQTFFIPSGSMEHTLDVNDRVLVNKLAYKYGNLHHGDIVVFKRPPLEPDQTINDLIKRVIALPGDTIESRNGLVYLNGQPLAEPYLATGMLTDRLPPTKIPEGQIFVMGDNRVNSQDGRFFGPIDEDLVVGKATFRIWPPSRMGSID